MRVRLVPAKDWLETDNQSTFLAENNYNENSPLYRRFDESEKLLDVWILRSDESKLLTGLFVASIGILMSIANVMMGCELDLATIWKTIKRPVAPAIGLFTQFILMPLLSYIIAVTIFTPRGLYSMALGIFVTGCAPAGGASNFWTLLLDGNVSLSITMTFISTCASLVMMPLWIHLLAGPFLQGFSRDSRIKIPYRNIIGTIAFLVVPLLIGVGIQKWKPNWAANARKIMRPFVIFVLIFVVVFGSLTQLYMFRMMNFPAIIGGLLLPWCGFMFGCFTAIITRREPPDVTAIAIETGIQNTGIAILLLKASFAQPDADIGMVLPVIVACFTPFPLLFGAAVHHTIKYIKKKRQGSVDVEKPAMILEKTEDKQTTLLLKDSDNLTPPGLSSPILKDSKTSMTTMLTTTSGIGTSTTGSQESTDKY
ncbi:hypothetical protein WR25_03347 isoform D [Diploscapter pachys]|nr:hypothetical protein WR25_03347 isoform B [Diploscapter pachys]PAV80789.1 hypothetical protein WR25_03347 isoform C [Diploscapter pachys]PAV80790.1 hypothetical protein WR25_03347 isoform D [Diploscapter pachys]